MLHHGYLPSQVDHIDGNRENNKIENLREATHQQNIINQKRATTNKSGFKNVHWRKDKNKWCVELIVNGKKKHIGYFDDLEVAKTKLMEIRNETHQEFSNNG